MGCKRGENSLTLSHLNNIIMLNTPIVKTAVHAAKKSSRNLKPKLSRRQGEMLPKKYLLVILTWPFQKLALLSQEEVKIAQFILTCNKAAAAVLFVCRFL